MKKVMEHALKPLIALFILFILIRSGLLDPGIVADAFRRNPGLLVLATGCYFFLTVVTGVRWYLLMKAVGLEISFRKTFKLHMIGLFFSSLLPGGTGGDLAKGYYLFRDHEAGRKAFALSSIAMDRAVGLYGLILIGIIFCALNFDLAMSNSYLRANTFFFFTLFIAASTVIFLLLSPLRTRLLTWVKTKNLPGKKVIAGLAESLEIYGGKRQTLVLSLGLTLFVHFGLTLCYYFILLALDLDLAYWDNALIVPIMTMINGIPISPGGIGVSEAAGEILYRMMGLGESGSEILAIYHVCFIVTSLLGLPFYFFYRAKSLP